MVPTCVSSSIGGRLPLKWVNCRGSWTIRTVEKVFRHPWLLDLLSRKTYRSCFNMTQCLTRDFRRRRISYNKAVCCAFRWMRPPTLAMPVRWPCGIPDDHARELCPCEPSIKATNCWSPSCSLGLVRKAYQSPWALMRSSPKGHSFGQAPANTFTPTSQKVLSPL